MSSGTTAEPIQPEAPVTKMRMEGLFGCAAGEQDVPRRRRGRQCRAAQQAGEAAGPWVEEGQPGRGDNVTAGSGTA
jgi:hypothetical protein